MATQPPDINTQAEQWERYYPDMTAELVPGQNRHSMAVNTQPKEVTGTVQYFPTGGTGEERIYREVIFNREGNMIVLSYPTGRKDLLFFVLGPGERLTYIPDDARE